MTRKFERSRFVLIIAGENPDAIIEKYDANKETEPYVKYYFKDRERLQKSTIDTYRAYAEKCDDPEEKSMIIDIANDYASMTATEFFAEFTSDCAISDETGDAYTDVNPDGKYSVAEPARKFAWPMPLKKMADDGSVLQAYSARKGDIDWDLANGEKKDIYYSTWELVIDGREPKDEQEETILKNMKGHNSYLESFGDKECYATFSTAFWASAFASEKDGWIEMSETDVQFDWVVNFYERFIANLPDDTKISMYEFMR